MKILGVATLGIAAVILVYLYTDRVANIPGPVTGGSPLVYKVMGSFEGVHSFSGDSNATIGGGCLIFQDANKQRACKSNTDCSIYDGYGYCVTEKGSSTCWFKPNPDADHCLRGKTLPGKYSLGPAKAFPQVLLKGTFEPAVPHGSDRVLWRVLTCQNLKAPGCNGGTEGVHKRSRYGPATEFKNKTKLYPEVPSKQPSG
jgi:hypothetical protein